MDTYADDLAELIVSLDLNASSKAGAESVAQAAARQIGNGGSIINIGSGVSRLKPSTAAVYTATKGAVDRITGVLAKELAPRKIRVNSINPGLIETEGRTPLGSWAPIWRRL
jgi:3-oxoacyl-[acyl-carrier protein] reductase